MSTKDPLPVRDFNSIASELLSFRRVAVLGLPGSSRRGPRFEEYRDKVRLLVDEGILGNPGLRERFDKLLTAASEFHKEDEYKAILEKVRAYFG